MLNNKVDLDKIYKVYVKALKKSINNVRKNNKDVLLNYNIMKNDDLDKRISKQLPKIIAN